MRGFEGASPTPDELAEAWAGREGSPSGARNEGASAPVRQAGYVLSTPIDCPQTDPFAGVFVSVDRSPKTRHHHRARGTSDRKDPSLENESAWRLAREIAKVVGRCLEILTMQEDQRWGKVENGIRDLREQVIGERKVSHVCTSRLTEQDYFGFVDLTRQKMAQPWHRGTANEVRMKGPRDVTLCSEPTCSGPSRTDQEGAQLVRLSR